MYDQVHRRTRGSSETPFMNDMYDSPRWNKVVPLMRVNQLTRIVLHGCVDGCPAYGRQQSGSVKPFQYFICNLPPWLRYKLKHLLIHILIPAHLKGIRSKKYYDFLGKEMTDLYVNGVDGVKVIVFGTTLDTPGRRELLNMQGSGVLPMSSLLTYVTARSTRTDICRLSTVPTDRVTMARATVPLQRPPVPVSR